jgi:hypothetical protein
MPNRIPSVQVSDKTKDDSSNAAESNLFLTAKAAKDTEKRKDYSTISLRTFAVLGVICV